METKFSLRNVVFCNINMTVFLDKDRMMDNVQKYNICILHTQYIQSLMQLKILFILTLTRHVSAAVVHHQVFLLKLFHCNFYI
jgi:hypothetical protein